MTKGFMGEYRNNMDAKGRVILPVAFRELMGREFVITRGIDQNLDLLPKDVWDEKVEKLEKLGTSSPAARAIKRRILGMAIEIEIDNQDRITVPQNLREACGLEKEIIFVGQGNYVEAWSKQLYDEMNEGIDFSELASGLDF